jgi:hypothetical protein
VPAHHWLVTLFLRGFVRFRNGKRTKKKNKRKDKENMEVFRTKASAKNFTLKMQKTSLKSFRLKLFSSF